VFKYKIRYTDSANRTAETQVVNKLTLSAELVPSNKNRQNDESDSDRPKTGNTSTANISNYRHFPIKHDNHN